MNKFMIRPYAYHNDHTLFFNIVIHNAPPFSSKTSIYYLNFHQMTPQVTYELIFCGELHWKVIFEVK